MAEKELTFKELINSGIEQVRIIAYQGIDNESKTAWLMVSYKQFDTITKEVENERSKQSTSTESK